MVSLMRIRLFVAVGYLDDLGAKLSALLLDVIVDGIR